MPFMLKSPSNSFAGDKGEAIDTAEVIQTDGERRFKVEVFLAAEHGFADEFVQETSRAVTIISARMTNNAR